jgi:hypothetical protein
MGIGDWGLGIGDWPNPQSPIPNKYNIMSFFYKYLKKIILNFKNNNYFKPYLF